MSEKSFFYQISSLLYALVKIRFYFGPARTMFAKIFLTAISDSNVLFPLVIQSKKWKLLLGSRYKKIMKYVRFITARKN